MLGLNCMETANSKNEVRRICLYCQKRKVVGRSDRLFCSLDCKNAYHRKHKNDSEKAQERIIKILKKNQQVLKEVLGEKSSLSIEMDKLIAKGFDNDYLTHIKKSKMKGYDYFYVFDYGYRKENDTMVKIVKAFQ